MRSFRPWWRLIGRIGGTIAIASQQRCKTKQFIELALARR